MRNNEITCPVARLREDDHILDGEGKHWARVVNTNGWTVVGKGDYMFVQIQTEQNSNPPAQDLVCRYNKNDSVVICAGDDSSEAGAAKTSSDARNSGAQDDTVQSRPAVDGSPRNEPPREGKKDTMKEDTAKIAEYVRQAAPYLYQQASRS